VKVYRTAVQREGGGAPHASTDEVWLGALGSKIFYISIPDSRGYVLTSPSFGRSLSPPAQGYVLTSPSFGRSLSPSAPEGYVLTPPSFERSLSPPASLEPP